MVPSLESLVSPYGVVSGVTRVVSPRGLPQLSTVTAFYASRASRKGSDKRHEGGAGRVLHDPQLATVVAIAEAAERYAGGDLHTEQPVWATSADLDGPVLDTTRIPQCSPAEYADSRCTLAPFDPQARIRWVRGVNLVDAQPTWVPAVMACYGLSDLNPSERFTYRISTGYAIHTDPVRALVGAVCEIIERDAIGVIWLQRLGLPPLAAEAWTDDVRLMIDWAQRHFIRTYLFDGTTDLGVPTVYCLQVAEHDQRARHIVSCATDVAAGRAAEKALVEALTIRGNFATDQPVPGIESFSDLIDGARYMARPERAEAFDFLIDAHHRREAEARVPADLDGDPLTALVGILRERDMQVVAVDRTTRELAAVGLYAVSVVIPDLQPMTLDPYAQFRGHPRLYEAPAAMGYQVHDESELNPWPQPFA